jgi:hypothetical protein
MSAACWMHANSRLESRPDTLPQKNRTPHWGNALNDR